MSLVFPATMLVLTITLHACIDNVLWRDRYGWTCRDYNRDPRECNSKLAVSAGGIDAYEACCACEFSVERRRDYASCLRTCSANEDACEAECTANKANCEDTCNNDFASSDGDNGGVVDSVETPAPEESSSSNVGLEIWVIVLIVLGVLLLLCIICIILYCLMMPRDEGTCPEDDCITQQPMLIGGGCDAPCETPCDAPFDNQYNRAGGAQMVSYGETQAYPQRNGW